MNVLFIAVSPSRGLPCFYRIAHSEPIPSLTRADLKPSAKKGKIPQRSRLQPQPTDDVAAPEPHNGEDDAKKRQQHAEDEEGFAAGDRLDEPVEVHPEKAGERSDGQEDHGHERQAIDLLALFAGNLGGESR